MVRDEELIAKRHVGHHVRMAAKESTLVSREDGDELPRIIAYSDSSGDEGGRASRRRAARRAARESSPRLPKRLMGALRRTPSAKARELAAAAAAANGGESGSDRLAPPSAAAGRSAGGAPSPPATAPPPVSLSAVGDGGGGRRRGTALRLPPRARAAADAARAGEAGPLAAAAVEAGDAGAVAWAARLALLALLASLTRSRREGRRVWWCVAATPVVDAVTAALMGGRSLAARLPGAARGAAEGVASLAPAAAALLTARAARKAARAAGLHLPGDNGNGGFLGGAPGGSPPRPRLRRTVSTSIAALRAADEADPGRKAAAARRAAAIAAGGGAGASGSGGGGGGDPGAAAPSFAPELAELRRTLASAPDAARWVDAARFGALVSESAGEADGVAPSADGGAATPIAADAAQPPPPPGTAPGDAELMRFADAAGLRSAAGPEAAAAALETAARRVLGAEAWARAGGRERARAARRAGPGLVSWAGTDASGRPVLAIRAAAAVAAGEKALQDAAAAVVAAVDAFVRRGDGGAAGPGGAADDRGPAGPADPPPADPSRRSLDAALPLPPPPAPGDGRITAVLDARGADPVDAARRAGVLKDAASALAAHYPGRLAAAFVVGLPPRLAWLLPAVLAAPGVPARTAVRVAAVEPGDGRLPARGPGGADEVAAAAAVGVEAGSDGAAGGGPGAARRVASAPARFEEDALAAAAAVGGAFRAFDDKAGGGGGEGRDGPTAGPTPRRVRVADSPAASSPASGRHSPSPRGVTPTRSALRKGKGVKSRLAGVREDGGEPAGAALPAGPPPSAFASSSTDAGGPAPPGRRAPALPVAPVTPLGWRRSRSAEAEGGGGGKGGGPGAWAVGAAAVAALVALASTASSRRSKPEPPPKRRWPPSLPRGLGWGDGAKEKEKKGGAKDAKKE